ELPKKVSYKLNKNALNYLPALYQSEIDNNLPAGLLTRMAYQESRFRDDIIFGGPNRAGAVGILQIIPRWHPDVDPTNPYDSIEYAGTFIRRLYDRFGSWDKALAAYNWGPTNVAKKWQGVEQLPTETRNYVLEIGGDVGLFV
ncbi:MAG: lytic transglycosylase domain-containing protein, partial [Methylococcales bacterium]